jgi:hypothetical protein
MSKHTPGPFWIAQNEGCFVVGADDRELAFVGTTVRTGTTRAAEQSRANAYLFAAAPDLLDVCEELATYVDTLPWETERRLRIAIGKAKTS